MKTLRFIAVALCVILIAPTATGAEGNPAEPLILIADGIGEAAFAVSTGAQMAYGNAPLKEEVSEGATVYELGDNSTYYESVSRRQVLKRLNASHVETCPEDGLKKMYLALTASLNESTAVCIGGEKTVNITVGNLKERYLEEIGSSGKDVNHVILSSPDMVPAAAAIAADQRAYLAVAGEQSKEEMERFPVSSERQWERIGALFNATADAGLVKLRETFSNFTNASWESGSDGWSVARDQDTSLEFGSTEQAFEGEASLYMEAGYAHHSKRSDRITGSFDFSTVDGFSFAVYDENLYTCGASGFGSVHVGGERIDVIHGDEVEGGGWEEFVYRNGTDFAATGKTRVELWARDNDKGGCGSSPGPVKLFYDSFKTERTGRPPSGNWTSQVLDLGPGQENLEALQIDVAALPEGSGLWAVVEVRTENRSVAKEVQDVGRVRVQNITITLPVADSVRVSFNMTGGAVLNSTSLFYNPMEKVPRGEKVTEVREALRNATATLARHGMYLEGREQYADGLYISLLGVPAVVEEDPVEAGFWSLADPADGKEFATDLPYADFNQDGMLDAAVGRYPDNKSLASRMYLRSSYYEGKEALVASEYLHQNWPVVLAYLGGGMYSGKSIESILEEQGYDVTRAVEYRAEPEQFLLDLTPFQLENVLSESDRVGEEVGGVLGQSVGTAASQVFVAVKALEYVERVLEQYLEFDWSTAGLDVDRARDRLSDREASVLGGAARSAAGGTVAEESITSGMVESLQEEGVQGAVAKAVYAFFWPDRYRQLTEENLVDAVPDKDIVYYTGIGNSSAWILPNEFSSFAGVMKTGRYNGSESFGAGEVPQNSAKLVFDNSDLAGVEEVGMRRAFLDNGAAAYIGTSTVNYAPFSSEIDTRFFRQGYTTGQSLKAAVNGLAKDSLTWDPFNAVTRDGVKAKMLKSFRLYGNPEMGKDPEVRENSFRKEVECGEETCTLRLAAEVNYSVVESGSNRTIAVEADGTLIESFRPIIPLLKEGHVLPAGSEVLDYNVSVRERSIRNVTVPVATPLSHGGRALEGEREGWFPDNSSRLSVRELSDGRREVSFVHAAFQHLQGGMRSNVSERVGLVLRYRTPYEMEVSAPDTDTRRSNVTVEVENLGRATGAEIMVQLKGRHREGRKTIERTLDPGENVFNLPVNVSRPGRYEAEAFMFVDNATLGPRSDTFTFEPQIPEEIPAPVEVVRGPSRTSYRWADGFEVSYTDSRLKISLENTRKSIHTLWTGNGTKTVLRTGKARVEEQVVSAQKKVEVETAQGSVRMVFSEGGRSVETGGNMGEEEALKLYRLLSTEKSELAELYQRRLEPLEQNGIGKTPTPEAQ